MTKYTPGPWLVRNHRIMANHPNGGGLQTVAKVWWTGINCPPLKQAKANACLLAEAPALLAACDWLTHLAHDIGKAGGRPEPGEWEAALEAAKTAIAAAKGEPSS